MVKIQRILVVPGETRVLADYFKVSTQAVRNALRFASDSEVALEIRNKALSRGAKLTSINVPKKLSV